MHWAKFNGRGWELKLTPKDATKNGLQTCIFIGNLVGIPEHWSFQLQLLDPRVIVTDSRAACLKVRERSDRRGKLPARPSDATDLIPARFDMRLEHILHLLISAWNECHIGPLAMFFFGFRVPLAPATPEQGRTIVER